MTPSLVTLGIDVSDRFSSYCVIDPAGDVVEEGRLRTTESALFSRFKDITGRVVVEAGTHSPWISRVFSDLGMEVIVANPRRVQLITQSTRKNDKADAQTLARLGRIDPKLLTPIIHHWGVRPPSDLAWPRTKLTRRTRVRTRPSRARRRVRSAWACGPRWRIGLK
jgi:transposase